LVVFTLATTALGLLAVALRTYADASTLGAQAILLLYSIPANTGLSLFSHEVALLDYGAHQHLLFSTASATAGTLIAAVIDWRFFVPLLGSERLAAHRERRTVRALLTRFKRAPFLVLVVTAATPIPFFPFKMMAFSVGYPLRRYLAAVTIARAPRYSAIAWVGAVLHPPAWLLLIALAVILAVALTKEALGHGMPVFRRMRLRRQRA
jgi:membrane protein YqaA with SNARE-associated domain